MTTINLAQVQRAIETTADTVIRNEHYFSDLDGLAGDGDFGTSLATGFKVIKRDLPTIEAADIGQLMMKLSMLVSKHVGGSSGPIWGTGFMKAGMVAKGKAEVTLAELAEMVGTAVDGIMARGGAQLGDKTLLDAVIPVSERLKAAGMEGAADMQALLGELADIADRAVDSTRSLVARRGRASQVGQRSGDTPDPGIVAIATILTDWANTFGAGRTATAPEVAKASQ